MHSQATPALEKAVQPEYRLFALQTVAFLYPLPASTFEQLAEHTNDGFLFAAAGQFVPELAPVLAAHSCTVGTRTKYRSCQRVGSPLTEAQGSRGRLLAHLVHMDGQDPLSGACWGRSTGLTQAKTSWMCPRIVEARAILCCSLPSRKLASVWTGYGFSNRCHCHFFRTQPPIYGENDRT